MNAHAEYEKASMLDSIGGIPMWWFRELDAACDAFFARRGIVFKTGFRENIRRDCAIQKAMKPEESK